MDKQIFSDAWHQIADLKLRLPHDVKIYKQFYRCEKWYVFQDRYNNRFFRVTPEAYRFIMAMDRNASVGEIWQECMRQNPNNTPNQNELVALLSQLHTSNLLYCQNRPDSDAMFERVATREKKEIRSKFASFLFLRIPLWTPENFLKKTKPVIDRVFGLKTLILWMVMGVLALREVIENMDRVSDQTQGILTPGNMVYLYLCLVFLKTCHEFGHAMMTKRFGGSVSTMGIMLLIFTPIPYMDASSSWAFRHKNQRILVGSAGIFVELFIAFIATLIWAHTGQGLVHSLAFNIMFIGSVSSLIFNGNPLLKFDAYYMLSDYLEIPNLYERASAQWRYIAERFILGVKDAKPSSKTLSTAVWLCLYGVLSLMYRVLVAAGIILFVAGKWFLLGCLTAVIFVYTWLIKPVSSYLKYLITDPKLRFQRKRVSALTVVLIAAAVAWVGYVPFYHSIRAPGVMKSNSTIQVYSPIEGVLAEVYVTDGQLVKKGDPIARINTSDLILNIERYQRQVEEIEALIVQAMQDNIADLKPLRKKRRSILEKIIAADAKQQAALIRAETDGVFASRDLFMKTNTWVKHRQLLGRIISDADFRFVAVVAQDQAFDLFSTPELRAEIRLPGQAAIPIQTTDIKVIPYEQDTLPAASLSWKVGGDIPTKEEDKTGTRTKASFFKVTAKIAHPPGIEKPFFYHDRRGEIRINLAPASLGRQFYKKFKQLLQQRYLI